MSKWALVTAGLLSFMFMGCTTFSYSQANLRGAGFIAGLSFNPDAWIDAINPGITLRAIRYSNPDLYSTIDTSKTVVVRYTNPWKDFEVIAAPPAGLEVTSVFFGLSLDEDTPYRVPLTIYHGRKGYFFRVQNTRNGNVPLFVRVNFGHIFAENDRRTVTTMVAQYSLLFATHRGDHILATD